MRRVLAVLLLVSVTAAPALADDFGNRQNPRAFWLKNQPWPEPRDRTDAAQPRFTKTYMDGIAQRFGVGHGRTDFFEQHIGGEGGPGLVGTVEGGAPALALRWHPGE